LSTLRLDSNGFERGNAQLWVGFVSGSSEEVVKVTKTSSYMEFGKGVVYWVHAPQAKLVSGSTFGVQVFISGKRKVVM
jgi:hypothetical protein